MKRRYFGARMTFWGALVLFAWSVYEFAVRAETIWLSFRSFFNMMVGEQIPLSRALGYVDAQVFEEPARLLAAALFALFAFGLRNRPLSGIVLLPCAAGLLYLGFDNTLFALARLAPVGLVAAGEATCLVERGVEKRRGKELETPPKPRRRFPHPGNTTPM